MRVTLLVDPKIVIETLHRMGIFNSTTKTLYPTCYLFENNGYEILHFKEVLALGEHGYDNFTSDDQNRKKAIIFNLINWNLIACDEDLEPHNKFIYVLRFENKDYVTISDKIKYSGDK